MAASAETALAAEVWINSRTDGSAGHGTRADPFDGSTQEKFDTAMAAIPKGAHIHLAAGSYVTRGVHLKEGWWLHGAGIEASTIRLADDLLATDGGQSASVLYNYDFEGFFCRIKITDLTLDCNRDHQPSFRGGLHGALNALTTAARHATIRRVRALGTWANPGEGFPFSVLSSGSSDGSNHVEIDHCESLGPLGYQTAISAFDQTGGRISGHIRHCLVVDGPSSSGFGAGGWKNFDVSDNTTRNMGAGLVIDTHDYENVLIARNRFLATKHYGILMNGGGKYRNIVVRRNRIEMDPAGEWCLVTGNAAAQVRIEHNVFVEKSVTRPALQIGRRSTGTLRGNVLREVHPSDLRALRLSRGN
ncbi:MAG: right-handed parallel beta-helix repeat-containing protein, partial [Verrucomicrobiota bacterium]|nr:right-handed parallel beta-helix repeat-containing protein [Verrucomicrobiota bacterium]